MTKKKSDTLDNIFEGIAQDMIERAERVNCSLSCFYQGLLLIRAEIDARITVGRDELDTPPIGKDGSC